MARGGSGRPYASLVLSACDHGGSPLLLLSDLAEHSKNLAAEPKAALLFDGTAGLADPLGERDRPAEHLIRLPRVDAQVHDQLDGLVNTFALLAVLVAAVGLHRGEFLDLRDSVVK